MTARRSYILSERHRAAIAATQSDRLLSRSLTPRMAKAEREDYLRCRRARMTIIESLSAIRRLDLVAELAFDPDLVALVHDGLILGGPAVDLDAGQRAGEPVSVTSPAVPHGARA